MNVDAFDERAFDKADYTSNPLTDGSLVGYTVYEVPMTSLTMEVAKAAGVKPRDAERSKNFFALGPRELALQPARGAAPSSWIEKRFAKPPWCSTPTPGPSRRATTSARPPSCSSRLPGPPGRARARRLHQHHRQHRPGVGAHRRRPPGPPAAVPRSYPITPASDILHELSKHKHFGVRTVQAEDEIAGVGAAIGAAFGGALGVTTTSGPGLDLKSESVGLAVSLELPLLVIDIQRGGPSTGLPTKTEQSDLLHAMYGRHGEAPVPIVAPMTPSHCFDVAIEAARIAVKYRTPVFVLSDGYLANGAEPWRLPDLADAARPPRRFATETNHTDDDGTAAFWPYVRDERDPGPSLGRPGTPGLEHRIGGLEKEDGSGNVSYDPVNHERMVHLRAAKVAGIAADIPLLEVDDPDGVGGAPVLVLGWGSTYGAIQAGVRRVRARGLQVAHAHLVHLNPFPPNLGDVLGAYEQGARARGEPGPAGQAGARRLPRRRQDPDQGPGRARSGPQRSRRPCSRCSGSTAGTHHRPKRTWPADDRHRGPRHDPQGLDHRPGGPVVPGVRGLLDPGRRADAHARAGRAAREHRVRVRHRLRGAPSRTT